MPLDRSTSKFGGLITRRERWGLSWRGWVALFSCVLLAAGFVFFSARSFLAQTDRVNSKILVVEGWMDDYGVKAALAEYHAGHYERILTTGGPTEGQGPSSSIYDTEAWQSAWLLGRAGIPKDNLQSVPSPYVGRDRTYNSALALRAWLREHQLNVTGINVITEDVHARRTRLLFQSALGRDIAVGIISAPNPDYDNSHWWRSSEGVRAVLGEGIAYIYAKFFFWPARPD